MMPRTDTLRRSTSRTCTRYLGIGLYAVPQTARLLRASPATVRRWLRAYMFAEDRDRDYPELADLNTLTFSDLIELLVILRLRDQRATTREVLALARETSARLETRYPFAHRRFHVEEARLPPDFSTRFDYEEDLARRYWPLRSRTIVLDPARSFGTPITARWGVPACVLAEMCKVEPVESVARWYGVDEQAVEASLEFDTVRLNLSDVS